MNGKKRMKKHRFFMPSILFNSEEVCDDQKKAGLLALRFVISMLERESPYNVDYKGLPTKSSDLYTNFMRLQLRI